jgi:hypothetical protein
LRRFVYAGLLVAVSVVVDQAHFGSQRIGAFEARAMASWFSDHALLAEDLFFTRPMRHSASLAISAGRSS